MINIEVRYKGIVLRGVANVFENNLVANLLEPVQGQKHLHYGWAASVCRSPCPVDKDGRFTDHGLSMAEGLLIEIYEEAQPEYKAEQKRIKIEKLKEQIEEIENE